MTHRHPLIGAQVVYDGRLYDVIGVNTTSGTYLPILELRTFDQTRTTQAPLDACTVLERTYQPETP